MSVKLYEFPPTRSARVHWTLLELDEPFESRSDNKLWGSQELLDVHPLGKLPAIKDEGRPLFESAAICTWLADKHSDRQLIAPSGTWERAQHDQWVAFMLSEVEAHLWSMARNTFVYKESDRLPEVIEQDKKELNRSLPVLDAHLKDKSYFVNDKFSITDIIMGYAVNWARRHGLVLELTNLFAYNQRLLDRPLCPYSKEEF